MRLPRVVLVLQEGLDARAVLGPGSLLRAFDGRAAYALMNTAVSGPSRTASGFLTVGAGTRLGLSTDPPCYAPSEQTGEGPAEEVYTRRVGSLPSTAWLVCPDLARFAQPGVGALGEAVRRRKGSVVLLEIGRRSPTQHPGALVAMDARGVVHGGAEVEPDKLAWALRRSHRAADLLVLDLDPALDVCKIIASLIDGVLDSRYDTLLALAPAPMPRDGPWDRLTPVVAWGRGVRSGVLTSATTHTRGLIANIDIAPTVAAWLGATGSGGFSGHPARITAGPGPADLLRFSHQVTLHRHALFPVLGGAGVLAVLTLALVVAALLGRPRPALLSAARGALLTVGALPLALLFAPLLGTSSVPSYGLVTLALSGGIAALALAVAGRLGKQHKRNGAVPPLLALFLATDLVLLVDLAFGAPLIARSLLSDFPLAGFRFYGIGNEYLGLLVGTATVGVFWLRESRDVSRLALLGGALLLFLVGHPAYGADFGGALTALAAFGVGFALWEGRRPVPTGRLLAGLAVALAVCAVTLFLIDAARPPADRTHLGQLADRMAREGPVGGALLLGQVAGRKWSMNLRILTSAPFVAAFTAVASLLALCYHETGSGLARLLAARPRVRDGLVAAQAGGAVGFCVNDSGAVVWGLATAAVLAALLDGMLAARTAPEGADADSGVGRGREDGGRGDQR